MPSYAELANFRDKNLALVNLWQQALARCYNSTGYLHVQAEVDRTPQLLLCRLTTRATLFAMGYKGEISGTREAVLTKYVEMRLDS